MKVLILEPGKVAREADIDHDLRAMQEIVGGIITVTYPYEEPVGVVCNDEGLLMGLPLNRKLDDFTIIAGTFFLCGLGEEDLTDLPPELMEKFKRKLYFPQFILRDPEGGLIGVPYNPDEYNDSGF